jgi:hypothetical protein
MKLVKRKVSVRSEVLMVSLLLFIILLVGQLSAQDKKAPQSKLAKDMVGAWVLVGTPDNIGKPPAKGGRLKFRGGKHWCITQADPETGEVVFHHGGTYTLDGNEYVEKVEYATENTKSLIKQTYKFNVKVEKDYLTQIGVGNSYNEVWKRLK